MADIPYARWYSDGTVAYTKGSTAITGTNTFWLSAGIKAGDIFVDPNDKIYEITAVNDSTSITLGKSYAGDTGTGKGYSIIRNFNGTMSPTLAKRVSILLNEFEQRYDLDMQTVTPKSAYDIAKDNGFTGTDAEWLETLTAYGVAVKNGYTGTVEEWLESLKAAGEWSVLNERTQLLTFDSPSVRNSIYRGKNLGDAVTDEQYAAIQAHTFDDMYPGDYWVINGHFYAVAGFREKPSEFDQSNNRMIIVTGGLGSYPMNDTDDMTGGFINTTMYNETIPELVETIIDPDFRNLAWQHNEPLDAGASPNALYWESSQTIKASLLRFEMIYGYLWPYYNTNAHNFHMYRLPIFTHSMKYPFVDPKWATRWLATRYDASHWIVYLLRVGGHFACAANYGLPTRPAQVQLYFLV